MDQILCFAGAEEGIYTTMRALLQPNDHVITLTPCYESLKLLPECFCQVDTVPVELDTNKNWFIDIEKIRAALRPDTKMIVVNFPHNPTGFIPTQRFQSKIRHVTKIGYLTMTELMYIEYPDDFLTPIASNVREIIISNAGVNTEENVLSAFKISKLL